jgi:hypothetical protein
MSYTITRTNGSTLVTIPDTEKNTAYGITLIGRNYSGYGVFLNDNFVSLLENFAAGTPPAQPISGQLWFNSDNSTLQLWQGANWKVLSYTNVSGTTPLSSTSSVGDLWWDTTAQQLKVYGGVTSANVVSTLTTLYNELQLASTDQVRVGDIISTINIPASLNITVSQILSKTNVSVSTGVTVSSGQTVQFTRGTNWNVIGPAYSLQQNVTGIVPTNIVDTVGISHTVGLIYQQGFVIGAFSRDNEFTPGANYTIARLPKIKPGITIIEDAAPQYVRTVLGNVTGSGGTTIIPLSSVAGLQIGDYIITANVAYSSQIGISAIYLGNSSVAISGNTTVSVNDVATFQRGTSQAHLFNGTATNAQQLNGITADRFATLSIDQTFQQDVTVAGNLYVGSDLQVWDDGGDLNITNSANGGDFNFYSTVTGIKRRTFYIEGPTGRAQVASDPTVPLGISTKQYTDAAKNTALNAITANVTALVNGAPASLRDFGNVATAITTQGSTLNTLSASYSLLAPLASPTFTGAPQAPQPPVNDNSGNIATTAYAQAVISALRVQNAANLALINSAVLARANIASPVFLGAPKAPTPSAVDNSANIATTAYVTNAVQSAAYSINQTTGLLAPLLSPAFDGVATAPTAPNLTYTIINGFTSSLNLPVSGGDSTIATTGFVANAIATMPSANLMAYATKVSPALEGSPTAPTPAATAANTTIATTAWVVNNSPVRSVNGKNGQVTLTVTDISGAAPIASPAFTGSPRLSVDPNPAEYSTWIATTAWVANITNQLAPKNNPIFTGTVTLPTPADNSNDTTAASTGWVTARISQASVPKWGGATKYVSSRAPTSGDGASGDIWFQYQ